MNNKLNPMMIAGAIVVVAIAGFALMQANKSAAVNKPANTVQNEPTVEPTIAPSVAEPTIEVKGASDNASMTTDTTTKTIAVVAGSFYYNPNEIRVKKGQKIKIVLTSKDMMHNFNIDEFNVKSDTAKAGETTTVEFVAGKTGTFEYYCSVGRHRQLGQVGKLIVE